MSALSSCFAFSTSDGLNATCSRALWSRGSACGRTASGERRPAWTQPLQDQSCSSKPEPPRPVSESTYPNPTAPDHNPPPPQKPYQSDPATASLPQDSYLSHNCLTDLYSTSWNFKLEIKLIYYFGQLNRKYFSNGYPFPSYIDCGISLSNQKSFYFGY